MKATDPHPVFSSSFRPGVLKTFFVPRRPKDSGETYRHFLRKTY